jgi:uncharacterized protein YkwD
MEPSKHRIHKLARTTVPGLLLAGAIAFAGCGGGNDDGAKAPAPANQVAQNDGAVVSADATDGLVGPAARSTKDAASVQDRTSAIPRNANRKTGAQKKGVAGGAACADSGMTPEEGNLAQVSAAVLCLVNGERAAAGLPALTPNGQLDQAAAGMAKRMVAEKFFAHETPDGKTVVDRVEPTGYIPSSGDWVVGENLAWGSGALSTPQAIVNGWMNSPGHKANILAADYKDIGVAAAMGSPSASHEGGTTFVHNFGAKSGADPDAELPSGSSAGGDSGDDGGATVAGTQATAAAKAAAAKKAKAKKKKKRSKKRKRSRRRR